MKVQLQCTVYMQQSSVECRQCRSARPGRAGQRSYYILISMPGHAVRTYQVMPPPPLSRPTPPPPTSHITALILYEMKKNYFFLPHPNYTLAFYLSYLFSAHNSGACTSPSPSPSYALELGLRMKESPYIVVFPRRACYSLEFEKLNKLLCEKFCTEMRGNV